MFLLFVRAVYLFLLLLGSVQYVFSADIKVENGTTDKGEPQQYLTITGDLLYSDIAYFKSISAMAPDGTIVFLSSNGGSLEAGIEIGREIKRRHMKTASIDMCASACALAWLAGDLRALTTDAKVGFHVAYEGGVEKHESGTGNALVGLYVGELGYKDNVVRYVTSAAPDSMQWLSARDASLLGIDVMVLDTASAYRETKGSTPDPSEMETQLKTFIKYIIDSNLSDKNVALRTVLENYSPEVQYFGSLKSLAEVLIDKSKYIERWPDRDVRIIENSVAVSCEGKVCSVTGVYDWVVANRKKSKSKSGSAVFLYKVQVGTDLKVILEDGKVVGDQ